MSVDRGDVVWYEPPDAKRRPYVVLTRTAVIPHLNQLVAAPLTTTIRGIPTEVELGVDDGLPADCVVSLDNISLVRRAHLTERLTRLRPDRMASVCRALQVATGC